MPERGGTRRCADTLLRGVYPAVKHCPAGDERVGCKWRRVDGRDPDFATLRQRGICAPVAAGNLGRNPHPYTTGGNRKGVQRATLRGGGAGKPRIRFHHFAAAGGMAALASDIAGSPQFYIVLPAPLLAWRFIIYEVTVYRTGIASGGKIAREK